MIFNNDLTNAIHKFSDKFDKQHAIIQFLRFSTLRFSTFPVVLCLTADQQKTFSSNSYDRGRLRTYYPSAQNACIEQIDLSSYGPLIFDSNIRKGNFTEKGKCNYCDGTGHRIQIADSVLLYVLSCNLCF